MKGLGTLILLVMLMSLTKAYSQKTWDSSKYGFNHNGNRLWLKVDHDTYPNEALCYTDNKLVIN